MFKTVDDKGRVTLGKQYAGRHVELDGTDEGVMVRLVRVVPDREAWLWENPSAIASVQKGLRQAGQRLIGGGPDLESAAAFAELISDDD